MRLFGRRSNLSETAQIRQAECYGFISAFLMPPRPMTVEEWGEWFTAERLPIMQASGLTVEEASGALVRMANAANGATLEITPNWKHLT